MALDTRGVLDGAMRGYSLMDAHYARQHQQELDDERMRMAEENNSLRNASIQQQMSLRDAQAKRLQEEYDRTYGTPGEDGKRTGGTYQEDRKRALKAADQKSRLVDAQISAADASAKASQYKLDQQKRIAAINDNMPLIKAGWQNFGKDRSISDVFDTPGIKGSAYDPRRYLSKDVDKAFTVLKNKTPEVINDRSKMDKQYIDALGVMYRDQVRGVVGQTDPITGKTIKDAKLGNVHLANDIDPNQPGDQPGIVLTTLVNYGDGKWVPKPITNNRSTDPNDGVKVIPLSDAMRDITSQLSMWERVSTKGVSNELFGDKKQANKNQSEYKSKLADIETKRLEAIGKLDASTAQDSYKTMVDQINNSADEAKQNLYQTYFGGNSSSRQSPQGAGTSVPAWANGDPNKIKFAEFMQSQGEDVGRLSPKQLDAEYADYNTYLKQKEIEKRNQAIIDNNAMISRDASGNPTYSNIPQ